MGAWGYGPYDSDRASEFVGDIISPLVSYVWRKAKTDEGFTEYDYDDARAVIELLLAIEKSGYTIGEDVFFDAEILLDQMADDEEWVTVWDDENKIRESVISQRRRVRAVYQRLTGLVRKARKRKRKK